MSDVVSLAPDKPQPVSDSLVKRLESLLEDARCGAINGMMFVTCRAIGVGHCRAYGRGWAGEGVSWTFEGMHGELTMLQWEMCAVRRDDAREGDEPEVG